VTCRYIDFQRTQAGGDVKPFDDSEGRDPRLRQRRPRQINNPATACLLKATTRKVRSIDEELFQQVVSEFQLLPKPSEDHHAPLLHSRPRP
jgi:hypothetical protein